jgi:hypothetical protein
VRFRDAFDNETVTLSQAQAPAPDGVIVRLPHIRRFRVCDYMESFVALLQHIQLPATAHIELDANWGRPPS